VKKSILEVLQNLIDRFIALHGITVIVVVQNLGDFEIWRVMESGPGLKPPLEFDSFQLGFTVERSAVSSGASARGTLRRTVTFWRDSMKHRCGFCPLSIGKIRRVT
jgi:hypothetical protein